MTEARITFAEILIFMAAVAAALVVWWLTGCTVNVLPTTQPLATVTVTAPVQIGSASQPTTQSLLSHQSEITTFVWIIGGVLALLIVVSAAVSFWHRRRLAKVNKWWK